MTVQELIDKLTELPEPLRALPVWIETESEGADVKEITAKIGESKIWWQADRIVLSGRY